ncbi:hypothetical protein I4U23_015908 [Adineta vaga]|nr:hypothetical protein I4U23_015908 [Adineta vaga]
MKTKIFSSLVVIYLYLITKIFALNLCPTAQWSIRGSTVAGASGSQATRLSSPTDVIVDETNSIYALDSGNYRILKFSPTNAINGTVIIKSSSGTQLNQFSSMDMISMDQDGNFYILDSGLSRITKWNLSMNTTDLVINGSSFVNSNMGNDDFLDEPMGMFIEMNTMFIWIADTNNHRIVKWLNSTTVQIICGSYGSKSDQFKYPQDIFVDVNNNYAFYVVDTDNHPGSLSQCDGPVWSTNAVTVAGSSIGEEGSDSSHLSYPYDMWLDSNDTIYVLDTSNYRIQLFYSNQISGTTVFNATQGNGVNQFSNMVGFSIDSNGNIYILDDTNSRVIKFPPGSSNGTIVAGGNGRGSALNKLNYPSGFFLEPITSYIWIADTSNCRIVKWMSLTNISLVAGASCGAKANQFRYPYDVFVDVDDSNTMYVVDSENFRIQRWFQGAFNGTTVAGQSGVEGSGLNQLSYPSGMILDKNKTMYIADAGNNRIIRWIIGLSYGSIIAGTNTYGSLPYQLYGPERLRFDSMGNLCVVDYENNRIQKFSLICSPTMILQQQLLIH